MRVRFVDDGLDRLETDPRYGAGHPAAVVKSFRKRMQQIRAAPDERTFYSLKSLHFEKLKGARKHQHSMRLNDQWRLVVQVEGKAPDKILVIVAIEDYH